MLVHKELMDQINNKVPNTYFNSTKEKWNKMHGVLSTRLDKVSTNLNHLDSEIV